MHLAHVEMFLSIMAMARFDIELFETGIEDVKFMHDFHIVYPNLDSKGVRAMVKGKSAEREKS